MDADLVQRWEGSSSESWRRERGGCVIGDGVYCYDGQFSEWRLK